MSRTILLDSGPLGLLMFPAGHGAGDECRKWLARRLAAGDRVIVPEIIDYELRRELIRGGFGPAVVHLDVFNSAQADRYLPLTTTDMKLAAQIWADARNRGVPTGDRHALDIDVILAAQARGLGLPTSLYVIATTNVKHLSQYASAELWHAI